MIHGIFHEGSGLGNQLHRYVATRCLALDKGYDFSMIAPDNFKGKSFMNLDTGIQPSPNYYTESETGKVVADSNLPLWEEKTNYYNPEFNFIEDNTIIDGEFQDERYFGHRVKEISEWLKTEPLMIHTHDYCAIGFRGGEFSLFPELFLPKEYWEEGINRIKKINPEFKFKVQTDDRQLAQETFPAFQVIQDMIVNWRWMREIKHAIIANSSFYILPRLLKHFEDPTAITIAPRYWARHNTKTWSKPQNYYKCFTYL